MLDLADIPDGTTDNESVLEHRYGQSDGDLIGFPAIDWPIAEKYSITERGAQTIVYTKAWLISWGM
ncbi:hypothetical protein KI387_001119, partial [Taxus chinensis]